MQPPTLSDQRKFEILYQTHFPAAVRQAILQLKDEQAAHDVVQDVFFSLLKNKRYLRLEQPLPYLYKAVRFACIKYQQRHASRITTEEHLPERSENPSFDENWQQQEAIQQALAHLPSRWNQAFELYLDGHSYQQAAAEMQVSSHRFDNILQKTFYRLRSRLQSFR